MTKQTIEFATSSAPGTAQSPWEIPTSTQFKDLILKPEFAARRHKFGADTWLRIVPPLHGSKRGWMMGLHSLNHPGGRHLHPRSLEPSSRGVFDLAYAWFKANRPEALFSKQNKQGYRFLANPDCLFWALLEEDGKIVARLILASGYDASRGGSAGLGFKILEKTRERDELGNLIANPADPETGVQINVTRTQPVGSGYPSYSIRAGRVPAPMSALLERMEPEELAALRPLESVVHVPDAEEEWALLERMVGPETADQIRQHGK